ncbi:phosphoglucosamine mutase [uncultured Alloprevotella sp.]|jgi:phosphoglucosamine mutase|uniref:phosphoglucosamine mutase n=1 Tax=uncultured Alloprevotella sp. TaxID=1283315 RepID=UPI002889CE13|nr:phosphoglucosamine mutase [uncultured Alloprevotella sp.]
MTLIKSISGFRGTIGGHTGDTLNPLDIVKSVTAYATLRAAKVGGKVQKKIVVGRDARISGEMVSHCVCGTLMGLGFDVVNIGLATTPTTEIAVPAENAVGGIILTASHNPRQWNALKLLNELGEFIPPAEAAEVVRLADDERSFVYADVDELGSYEEKNIYDQYHIDMVKGLELVDVEAIRNAKFHVCLDTINSVGGIILPKLLDQLGVTYDILNGEPNGQFAHNPEPLRKNLNEICSVMKEKHYDIGFVCDPDVDRLVFIQEDGEMYGEEYTLVTCADWVLQHTKGNTVSNLSSTRALRDVTEKNGGQYTPSAVGEINVVLKMKETNAVIGGEGNGGIIYPAAHYGRDTLVGIALMLTYMAKSGKTPSQLKAQYPLYAIAKNRIDLQPQTDLNAILAEVRKEFAKENLTEIDGLKIDTIDKWVHLRKSNTEPIIRIFSEAHTIEEADALGKRLIDIVEKTMNKQAAGSDKA